MFARSCRERRPRIFIVLVIFLGLLAAGMAIPFAIGVPAIVYLLLRDGGVPALKGIGLMSWGSMNSFALTAIPLFILMAEIMQHSDSAFRIYRGLARWCASCRAACCRPTSPGAPCSRRSPVRRSPPPPPSAPWRCRNCSAATTGMLAAGSLAAGGTLGILIPPDRHDRLRHLHRDIGVAAVHGGIVPGLVLTALFMGCIWCIPAAAGDRAEAREPARRAWAEFVGAGRPRTLRSSVLIGGTMGSLYAGFSATPTEAAAVGCFAALRRLRAWGLGWADRAQTAQ